MIGFLNLIGSVALNALPPEHLRRVKAGSQSHFSGWWTSLGWARLPSGMLGSSPTIVPADQNSRPGRVSCWSHQHKGAPEAVQPQGPLLFK